MRGRGIRRKGETVRATNRGATLILVVALALGGEAAVAQEPPDRQTGAVLGALVQRALEASPALRAARQRVEAARAAIGPAGSLDDPMLMLGWVNQPLRGSMEEEMTMRVLGASQMLPYPGKRDLLRTAAERELAAAEAELEAAQRAAVSDVKVAFYEL